MSGICFALLMLSAVSTAEKSLLYNLEKAGELFEEFIGKYNKQYKNEIEKANRFEIFLENLKEINILNEKYEQTQFGINKFTDLTDEEFNQKYTGRIQGPNEGNCSLTLEINNETIASNNEEENFDWRDKGVVSAVKDQDACGSCWAFSATGNIESVNAIKTGSIVDLSEQQLLDCDTLDIGCYGGVAMIAIQYFVKNGAISEQDYPYVKKRRDCKYNADKVAVKIKGCAEFYQKTEDELANILRQTAPLSIGIYGSSLKHYEGGIIQNDQCGAPTLNHYVLIVGYGKDDNGIPYWIFKNSWGSGWGEKGFFRLQRGVSCLGFMNDPAITAVM